MADPSSRSGARYATPEVLEYVNRVHAPHDVGLQQAFDAPQSSGVPAIQVGTSEGRTLQLLLRLIGARRVVEIGTLVGYSAIWIARALPKDGRLISLEKDPRHAEIARANLVAAGVGAQVDVRVGEAVQLLDALEGEGPFDAVFIDADKISYDQYGRFAARSVRKGGLLLGDNAYLFGRLCDDDLEGQAMRRFHEEAAVAFETVCLPTPDGLLLGIKR